MVLGIKGFMVCREIIMPKLTFKDRLPSPDEFQKALAQAMANTNPVDDLLELANELWVKIH